MFYSHDKKYALQVIHIKDQIEIHLIYLDETTQNRSAFEINDAQLVDWLKSGFEPIKNRITPDQSSSEILRYKIKQAQS